MRSLILNNLRDSLIAATDEFLAPYLGHAENIYSLGPISKKIQSLKSDIRSAEDPITLHTNTTDFINYHLGGVRGFVPWSYEFKLKSKLKLVLAEERYSIAALAKAHILEADQIIKDAQGEIEKLKKARDESQSDKGKEEASSKTSAPASPQKLDQPKYSDSLREKEFSKIASINSELENQIQSLKATVKEQEAQKQAMEAKLQTAMSEIEKKNEQIAGLEQRIAQQPIQPQPASKTPHKTPQRLARGVFGR